MAYFSVYVVSETKVDNSFDGCDAITQQWYNFVHTRHTSCVSSISVNRVSSIHYDTLWLICCHVICTDITWPATCYQTECRECKSRSM